VAEGPRIEELRRRVEADPASIAFAQLAEEYRRAGDYEQAVRVSRAGLAQYPNYLSARVTLGRALLELQQFEEAAAELDLVIQAAPDNLAAIRTLADIHQRRADLEDSPKRHEAPPAPGGEPVPPAAPPPNYARALEALDNITVDRPTAAAVPPEDPALGELESWLDAIVADRKARGPIAGGR
jgi:tetratricopeptide (TPR) repeat protein